VLRSFAGGRLFGTSVGSSRPWVLALHGWRRTHRDFDQALVGIDAVALDLPGFGATPPPSEVWGSAEYAKAVAPVLDEMALPAVVVGHSFGGTVALHLAAVHPERIRALVLTGVPLDRHLTRRSPPARFRLGRALNRIGVLGEERMEQLRLRYGSLDYRAAEGVMRSVLVRSLAERYDDLIGSLVCPVELVWGELDGAVPLRVAEEVAKRVPGARLTVVEGEGHLVPTSAPAELRDAILRHRP
jgi:pimeloyl-ACP methyl ester carboxylesterase